jgi:hypothetical protein
LADKLTTHAHPSKEHFLPQFAALASHTHAPTFMLSKPCAKASWKSWHKFPMPALGIYVTFQSNRHGRIGSRRWLNLSSNELVCAHRGITGYKFSNSIYSSRIGFAHELSCLVNATVIDDRESRAISQPD